MINTNNSYLSGLCSSKMDTRPGGDEFCSKAQALFQRINEIVAKIFKGLAISLLVLLNPASFLMGGLTGILWPVPEKIQSSLERLEVCWQQASLGKQILLATLWVYALPISPLVSSFLCGAHYGSQAALKQMNKSSA